VSNHYLLEWDGCQAIHGHGQGVSLCGALFSQNDVSINKEFSGTSVHVDEYGGNGWAEAPDVVQCNLAVEGIECISSIH